MAEVKKPTVLVDQGKVRVIRKVCLFNFVPDHLLVLAVLFKPTEIPSDVWYVDGVAGLELGPQYKSHEYNDSEASRLSVKGLIKEGEEACWALTIHWWVYPQTLMVIWTRTTYSTWNDKTWPKEVYNENPNHSPGDVP